MAIFSTLRSLLRVPLNRGKNEVAKRFMSEDRTFPLQPSRFQWNKFKDLVHFYVMLGVIPCTLVITYCNVFIGPATLTEIPEGYTPKHWEYVRHPISRFIAKYVLPSPQQEYEKYCCVLFMEEERIRMRQLEQIAKAKMGERQDYQAYYYVPISAKYHRIQREAADEVKEIVGLK